MSREDQEKNPKHSESVVATSESRHDVSRRDFLRISSISVAAPLVIGPEVITAAGRKVPVHGPGKVPMTFAINGKQHTASLEPRIILLDALRDQFGLIGAKRVCDRAECGACTVLMNNKAVYACSVLAIEAQRAEIQTVESLMQGDSLHPVQQAFVENDASQCGFCTPGFVMACNAFAQKNLLGTSEDLRRDLSGNFCRCGTYDGIKKAVAQLSKNGG
jgi:xanthine dehydrogenase YagT iron-sulfur-binding subunit